MLPFWPISTLIQALADSDLISVLYLEYLDLKQILTLAKSDPKPIRALANSDPVSKTYRSIRTSISLGPNRPVIESELGKVRISQGPNCPRPRSESGPN